MREREAGWSNPKVLGILAVIFICGLACGSAITSTVIHSRLHAGSGNPGIDRVPQIGGWQRLKDELELTPEQVKIVTKELDDYGKYYQNIEDQREDVAALGTQHILSVLTPLQKQRFYRLLGMPETGPKASPVSSVR